MTMHIHYKDNKCQKCSVPFIPFKKDFKCPKCGEATNDFFDFIPELIDSMKSHKARYGSYMPDAWYRGSLAEYIQSVIFKLFDTLEYEKSLNPKKFIIGLLSEADWEDEKYLQKHIENIALATYEIYENEGKFKDIKRGSAEGEEPTLSKLRVLIP